MLLNACQPVILGLEKLQQEHQQQENASEGDFYSNNLQVLPVDSINVVTQERPRSVRRSCEAFPGPEFLNVTVPEAFRSLSESSAAHAAA